MPVSDCRSIRWFPRFWTFLLCAFVHSFRIGEATVPGPQTARLDSFVDPPAWTLPGDPDFCLGLFNPSGISNKLHMLDFMPVGWWHVAETQASKYQQCALQGYIGSLSRKTGRHLRSTLGAPAPLSVEAWITISWCLDWCSDFW